MTNNSDISTKKDFKDTHVGGFLDMLLSNGGSIASVISAINGKGSLNVTQNGEVKDVTSDVKQSVEAVSAQQGISVEEALQKMKMQLDAEKEEKRQKTKRNLIYAGGGVVVLSGIGFLVYKKMKKNK